MSSENITECNEVVEEGSEAKAEHHQHKCCQCDTVWEHSDSCSGNRDAHKCPKCGEIQSLHYNPLLDKEKARRWVARFDLF